MGKNQSSVSQHQSGEIYTGNRSACILGIMEQSFILIIVVIIYGCMHLRKFIDLCTLSTVVWIIISSVQFSRSVMSDSLQCHELQCTRPPCPSPTPGVHSNSHPSSRWCHPVISSSLIPFSPCPQSLPASGSFPMSQLSAWGGKSTGVSALASFLPKSTQDWSPSEWTGWISLAVQETLKSLL